jgi:hypothetical protein
VFNTTFNNISVISLILELCQQYSIFFIFHFIIEFLLTNIYISSSDNKLVSHWIMFDYFFHV